MWILNRSTLRSPQIEARTQVQEVRVVSAASREMNEDMPVLQAGRCNVPEGISAPGIFQSQSFVGLSFRRAWISRSKAALSTMPGCTSAIFPARSMSKVTGIPLSTPNCLADSKVPITMR